MLTTVGKAMAGLAAIRTAPMAAGPERRRRMDDRIAEIASILDGGADWGNAARVWQARL
ncbi:hypothetical protein STVA_40680 [Allostella vacuolata]|nr:hypothetical protein STVA_40680 [Stella vacuolata]